MKIATYNVNGINGQLPVLLRRGGRSRLKPGAHHLENVSHSPFGAPVVLLNANNRGDRRVEGETEAADTPDAFLKALGESLKGKEGVDADLATILKTHLLKTAPAQNAVAQAKDAILKLASERANPPQPEVANG